MWPDRVSNPGPLTYESDALPTALRGPAVFKAIERSMNSTEDYVMTAKSSFPLDYSTCL